MTKASFRTAVRAISSNRFFFTLDEWFSALRPLEKQQVLIVFPAALALWMLNHPYIGFDYHDTRVYAVLAFHWLTPSAYAQDPFFLFGSQDKYSLFSPLFGTLIYFIGLPNATMAVLLSGAIAWIASAIWLARMLLPWQTAQIASVLAVAVLMQNYSPNGTTFVLNEFFATARSLAFPLGALALAAWLDKKHGYAFTFAIVALLIHPLIGIWPVAVAVLLFLPVRLGIVGYFLAIATCLVAGFSEYGPFKWMDSAWVALVKDHASDVLVGDWGRTRLEPMLCYVSLCVLAGCTSQSGISRRLYFSVAAVSGGGYVLAAVCSHWMPSQFLVQAQLWRSMWIAAMLSPIAATHLFFFIWNWRFADLKNDSALKSNLGPWIAVGGALLLWFAGDVQGWILLLLCFASSISPRVIKSASALICAKPNMLKGAVLALAVIELPFYALDLSLLAGTLHTPYFSDDSALVGLLLRGGQGVGFILLAAILYVLAKSRFSLPLVSLVFLVACLYWDMRSEREQEWGRRIAQNDRGNPGQLIKRGDVVLWDSRMPARTWFELGTAHYAGPTQSIGIVFSEAKAEELIRRADLIRAARDHEADSGRLNSATPGRDRYTSPFHFQVPIDEGLPMLCRDQALDWIITPSRNPLRSGATRVWDELEMQYVDMLDCAYKRRQGI